MEKPLKPAKLEIKISETDIILSKSEELQREKLGWELAQFLIRKNPKLDKINELSGQFARKKRLNLGEIKSILRYSLPEIINPKMTKNKVIQIQIIPKSQDFSVVDNYLENYFCQSLVEDFDDFCTNLSQILKHADLTILEIRFLANKINRNFQLNNTTENNKKELIKDIFEIVVGRILFD